MKRVVYKTDEMRSRELVLNTLRSYEKDYPSKIKDAQYDDVTCSIITTIDSTPYTFPIDLGALNIVQQVSRLLNVI